MLSSPSVCCHIENKNTLKEVQTSTGELLLYRTLPNKGCSTFCKTLLEDISKPETKKNDNSFSSQVNLNIQVLFLITSWTVCSKDNYSNDNRPSYDCYCCKPLLFRTFTNLIFSSSLTYRYSISNIHRSHTGSPFLAYLCGTELSEISNSLSQ